MEITKITSKDGLPFPSIFAANQASRWVGDNILFVEEAGRVYILNASMEAIRKAQAAFVGEAERVGLKDENDVVATIKELRRER